MFILSKTDNQNYVFITVKPQRRYDFYEKFIEKTHNQKIT